MMIGRLVIPYITKAGVVDLVFRCVQAHDCKDHNHPKYLRTPGAPHRLYNTQVLFAQGDYIAISEGELDAITLSSCGLKAVGVPGAQAWRAHYSKCLEDFAKVYVFCDGDKPGTDFGAKIAKELDNAVVLSLPAGEDCNSLFVAKGREALREMVGL